LFVSVATGRPCYVYQRIAMFFKEVKQQVLEKLASSDGSRHEGGTPVCTPSRKKHLQTSLRWEVYRCARKAAKGKRWQS